MAGRKVGVGFNVPRVATGHRAACWRLPWELARRMTRMQRQADRRLTWRAPLASSVVETVRALTQR